MMGKSELKRSVTISVVASVTMGILGYSLRVILARNLSIDDYGLLYSVMSFFMIIGAVIDLGIGKSGLILMSQAKHDFEVKKVYGCFSLLRLVLSLSALIVTVCCASDISNFLFKNDSAQHIIEVFSLWLLFTVILGGNLITLDVLLRPVLRNTLQLIPFAITLIMLLMQPQLDAQIAARYYMIGVAVPTVVLSIILPTKFKLFYTTKVPLIKEVLPELLRLSKWIAISTAGVTAMFNLDSLMLAKLSTLEQVGFYNGALPIAQIPLTILMFIPKVFIPKIATLSVTESKSSVIKKVCSFQCFVFIPCLVGLIIGYFVIDDIIFVLFGNKFVKASSAAFILCCGVPFYGMSQISTGFLQSIGKEKVSAIVVIIAVILNFICNFLLIPKFGIDGAASATTLTYFAMFALLQVVVKIVAKQVVNVE